MKLKTIRKFPRLLELFIKHCTFTKKEGAILSSFSWYIHVYYISGNKVCIKEKGQQSIKNVPFSFFLNNIDRCYRLAKNNEYYLSTSLFTDIINSLITRALNSSELHLKTFDGYEAIGLCRMEHRRFIDGIVLRNDKGEEKQVDYFEYFDYLDI